MKMLITNLGNLLNLELVIAIKKVCKDGNWCLFALTSGGTTLIESFDNVEELYYFRHNIVMFMMSDKKVATSDMLIDGSFLDDTEYPTMDMCV